MNTPVRQGPVDEAVRCFYADDPASRPECTLTAVVRFGTVALCPTCRSRRSNVGKGTAPVALPTRPALDVLDNVATAQAQAAAAQRTLAAAVARARQAGHPWSTIGACLGISRQAAQQRFTTPATALPPRASGHESTKPATRAS